MKNNIGIISLLSGILFLCVLISCGDDDSTGPTFTPSAKANIDGAINLSFQSFSSTFSQESFNNDVTTTFIATMDDNGNKYELKFVYNDYFEEKTYDMIASNIGASFTINDNTTYNQLTQGMFTVTEKNDDNFDVNFGFIAKSEQTGDSIIVTSGFIIFDE